MSQLPSHARVVVIGGGVVGTSVAYHLAKKGWSDVVLLERRELSCGSSWHAAGQIHIINSNANLSGLQLHTLKFYPELERESGQDIGLHRTGQYYLASTKERMDYLIQEQAKLRDMNPDIAFVDLAEVKRMNPLIETQHYLGALFDPLDGYVDPASVVQAYAKAARGRGASIYQHTKVEATNPRADGGWDVVTEAGTIVTEYLVNAAGLWARDVGWMAGINLPVLAMEHHYLITESIPELQQLSHEVPAMVDYEANCYGRQERDGMLLGTYEEGGQPWSVDSTPWDFGHELLPDALDRIGDRLEVAFQRFPLLEKAGIKKVVNGPFTFAPDGNALVGPVGGLRNYWVACGVMAGYAQGAGVGLAFAEWMVEGEPGLDVFAMDVARFGDFATRHYTHERVIENFGRRFKVTYPNEQLTAARPWRTTPLYDEFTEQGACFGVSYGLEHPLWFAPKGVSPVETPTYYRSEAFAHVAEEVRRVREGVGVLELANFAKYTVAGEHVDEWLDTLFAGKLPAVGRCGLSPVISPRGRLLGDLSITNFGEYQGRQTYGIVGSGAAQAAHMRLFLAHRPELGVAIHNHSSEMPGLGLSGPKSREVLQRLTRRDVSDEAFRFMSGCRMEVGGFDAIVLRVSFTGELGYEIYTESEYHRALYHAIRAAGADFDIAPFGGYALMSMRLEKNFGAWTMDFREDFTAQEAGLDMFIAYDKEADFIGKSAARDERQAGPRQKRVTFVVDVAGSADNEIADARGDEPIYFNDEYAGFVTSGGYGHYVGKSFAIGYIRAELAQATEPFAIEIMGRQCPATIQPTPMWDPTGSRMRG